jgi:hypothetical protein
LIFLHCFGEGVTTPPRPTEEDVARAIASIYDRHRRSGAEYLDEIGSTPAEVLSYLRKRGAAIDDDDVRELDLYDAAVLHVAVWHEMRQQERWLFTTADMLAVDRRRFGRPFGIKSSQGFAHRRDRLTAEQSSTGGGRPDERIVRGDRTTHTGGASWIAANAERLDVMVAQLRRWDSLAAPVSDDTVDTIRDAVREVDGKGHSRDSFELIDLAVEAIVDDAGEQLSAELALLWRSLVADRQAAGRPVS